MTPPSAADIHVILPGERTGASPRQALRAALAAKADVIVVVAPGDAPDVAPRLAAQLAGGDVAVASPGRPAGLGPGAGSLAIRPTSSPASTSPRTGPPSATRSPPR
jgi:hypothetical protein